MIYIYVVDIFIVEFLIRLTNLFVKHQRRIKAPDELFLYLIDVHQQNEKRLFE